YRANEEGLACGYCDSCELRKKGFKEAEIKDPTQYITKV
ncbi:7-cyano-7-deazaguanine synthase, partial [Coxiella burnetii]